jgi:hypothetical protein
MTSISAISGYGTQYASNSQFGGVSGTYTTMRPPPPPRDGKDPMDSVAKALGLSGDDLKSRLDSGRSMSELAKASGLSRDDLLAAIKAGMPSPGANGLSDSDKDTVAGKIADQRGRPDGPPPQDGNLNGLNDSTKRDQINELLGGDAGGLDSVNSAKQFVELLQKKGVDLGALKNVLNSGDLLNVTA